MTTYIVFIFLFTSLSLAQEERATPIKLNPYSSTVVLGVDAAVTFGRTDYSNIRLDYLGRASLEYLFPSTSNGIFGITGFVSGGYVGGQSDQRIPSVFRTSLFNIGAGFTYALSIKDVVYPYIFAGASYLFFDPRDENNKRLPNNAANAYKREEIAYVGEAGLHFLISDGLSLNLGVGGEVSSHDNWDDIVAHGDNDYLLDIFAGMSYAFDIRKDSDGDGVPDDVDQCPNTPSGIAVDEFGCPIDSDHDGVPDYRDACPNTPAGVKVNNAGCPIDSDHDGVPDYLDKCPNTPASVRVDSAGCPLDSDHDGVPDYLDKCPNTPAGVQVDKDGCPIKKEVKVETKIQRLVLNGNTNFESGKASLLSNAYELLAPLVKSMKEDTTLRFKVAGYTDAIGSDRYNMDLSRERAQAVVDYLVSQGIDANRFEVVPMGKQNPVATNKTPEGRAMNRRVEITPNGK